MSAFLLFFLSTLSIRTLSGICALEYDEQIKYAADMIPPLSSFTSFARIKKRLQHTKIIEYMHIPKCGTLIYRNVCESKKLNCLDKTTLLNRKCGLIGEHCDWLSKYNCYKKYSKSKGSDLLFFTLLRDPVSRVRSYYSYFKAASCRAGRPKGSGWSKSLCDNANNYTAWLLDGTNWSHNLMTRMLYGRKMIGNSCRISERRESIFWKYVIRKQQRHLVLQTSSENMIIEKINRSTWILDEAKNNLFKYFLLWGPQSEIETFFCVLQQMLGKKVTWNIAEIIKGRKTQYSKKTTGDNKESIDVYSESNNRLVLELNQLDNGLYEWAKEYWSEVKKNYHCF